MSHLVNIVRSKDGLAGLGFLLIGTIVLADAINYEFGSLLRMGPAFFPVIIGGLLSIVGILLVGKAFLAAVDDMPRYYLRPTFFIIAALLLFAYGLPRIGLIVSTVMLVMISRLAFQPARPMGALVLSGVLVVMAIGIFGYLLRMPLNLWP